jgi:hypothetical protein
MSLANQLVSFGRIFDRGAVAFLMVLGAAAAGAVVLLGF